MLLGPGTVGGFDSLQDETDFVVGEVMGWLEGTEGIESVGATVELGPNGCDPLTTRYEATGIDVSVATNDSVADGRALVAWLEHHRDVRLVREYQLPVGGERINVAVDGRDFVIVSGRPGEALRVFGGTGCYRRE